MERDFLGMTPEEMQTYLARIMHEEAAEAAARNGISVDAELNTVAFAAVRAATSYAIHLVAANNALLTRQLIKLGVIADPAGDEAAT